MMELIGGKMKSQEFCYWLQGYFELIESELDKDERMPEISRNQVSCIQKHLALVFAHEIDPSYGDEAHQVKLNKIHKPGGQSSGKSGDITFRC